MSSLAPVGPQVFVAVDAPLGRPRSFCVRGQRLAVTALDAMRDETAAYAPGTGPRRVFLVRAQRRRYRLTHLLRDGRWIIEEVSAERVPVRLAA
jgi:hypothetical protein